MGEVVSIRQSTDDDLHALFADSCPKVSDAVNNKVRLASNHALGVKSSDSYQPSIKLICVMIVGACLLGAGLVKGFTSRWNSAVESTAMYAVQAEKLNEEAMLGAALPATEEGGRSWQRSKGAWAEYITRLERDPFYRHVQQEKMRFEARYPSEPLD